MTLLTTSKNLFPALSDFLLTDNVTTGNKGNLPGVNIFEDKEGFTIEVAAPGMRKEDFKLQFEKNILKISCGLQEKEENVKYLKREFNYSSFERSFIVPEKTVDSEKISAAYNDGILSISLSKREELKPKPAKEIEIA